MKTKRDEIKQKIVAVLVVAFMLGMFLNLFGTFGVKASEDAGITTQAIVTGGELSIDAQGQAFFKSPERRRGAYLP